jgi:hypothetical protein
MSSPLIPRDGTRELKVFSWNLDRQKTRHKEFNKIHSVAWGKEDTKQVADALFGTGASCLCLQEVWCGNRHDLSDNDLISKLCGDGDDAFVLVGIVKVTTRNVEANNAPLCCFESSGSMTSFLTSIEASMSSLMKRRAV